MVYFTFVGLWEATRKILLSFGVNVRCKIKRSGIEMTVGFRGSSLRAYKCIKEEIVKTETYRPKNGQNKIKSSGSGGNQP